MADSDYIQADLTDEQRLAVMAKIVAGASPQDAYVAVLGSRANDKTRGMLPAHALCHAHAPVPLT